MSTRSNIYLKLKEETKGTTIKFDKTKLPQGERLANDERNDNYPIKDVEVPKDAKFMRIYHHWDGYISGLGKTLNNDYKDYDTILNMLVAGDMSSINDGVLSYQGWRNEKTPPQFFGDIVKVGCWDKKTERVITRNKRTTDKNGQLKEEIALNEEYAYLFDGEKWWVTYWEYDEKTQKCHTSKWIELAEAVKQYEN